MQPQKNLTVVENPFFTMWLDEEGILCFISKKHPPQKKEDTKQLFEEIKNFRKGKNAAC